MIISKPGMKKCFLDGGDDDDEEGKKEKRILPLHEYAKPIERREICSRSNRSLPAKRLASADANTSGRDFERFPPPDERLSHRRATFLTEPRTERSRRSTCRPTDCNLPCFDRFLARSTISESSESNRRRRKRRSYGSNTRLAKRMFANDPRIAEIR